MLWSVGICQRAILFIHSYTSFRCRWSVIQNCTTNIEMISLCYTFLSLRSCSLSLLLSLAVFGFIVSRFAAQFYRATLFWKKSRYFSSVFFFLTKRLPSFVACVICKILLLLCAHFWQFFLTLANFF